MVFRAAWRGRSEPYVAGLSAALVGFSVWVAFNFDWSPATGMFWLLAGALWSAASPSPRLGEQSKGAGSASITGSARRAGVRNPVFVVWQPALAVMLAMAAIEFA